MRDILSVVGGQGDELQKAEWAIRAAGAECVAGLRESLLRGRFGEAVAKMSTYAQFKPGIERGKSCPGQAGGITLDFVAEIGGVECWFDSVVLDGELAWLVDNDRSTICHEVDGEGHAVAREIVTRVSERIGRLSGWDRQTVAVVWDPMGTITRHGGLEEALGELGRRLPWLSALVLAKDGRLEVHDVPGSANALDGRVREGILRISDRVLLAPDMANGPNGAGQPPS